jgi:hypothetical protein
MMALWLVEINTFLVVEAEDELGAEACGSEHSRDEILEGNYTSWVHPIRSRSELPQSWIDCYPWGGDGERSCWEMLPDTAPPTKEELEAMGQSTLDLGVA